jgi:hypothetical protein
VHWPSETSGPPNQGPTTTPTLPPPGPLRSPAIGGLDVVDTFTAAAVNRWGTPTSVLTDGAIFTATPAAAGAPPCRSCSASSASTTSAPAPINQTCDTVCEDLSTMLHRFGLTPAKV